MNRCLLVFCIMFLLALPLTVNSQIVINSADLNYVPGVAMTKAKSDDYIQIDLGSAGENQSWDFSGIELEGEYQEFYGDPAETPAAHLYPTANICWYQPPAPNGMQMFVYMIVNEQNATYLGMATHVPAMDTIISSQVDMIGHLINFPVRYGDEWDYITISEYSGTNFRDSVHCVIDAWGSVTDVAGTFDCLRMRQHITATDTYEDQVEVTTDYSYSWIVPQIGAIIEVQSLDDEQNPDFNMGYFIRTISVSTVGVRGNNPELPSLSILNPAYPNPFNPQTNLQFTVAKAGVVTIEVFDISGRMVSSVVNGFYYPGNYQTPFNAAGLGSGTYVARFQAGNVIQSQSMTLTK